METVSSGHFYDSNQDTNCIDNILHLSYRQLQQIDVWTIVDPLRRLAWQDRIAEAAGRDSLLGYRLGVGPTVGFSVGLSVGFSVGLSVGISVAPFGRILCWALGRILGRTLCWTIDCYQLGSQLGLGSLIADLVLQSRDWLEFWRLYWLDERSYLLREDLIADIVLRRFVDFLWEIGLTRGWCIAAEMDWFQSRLAWRSIVSDRIAFDWISRCRRIACQRSRRPCCWGYRPISASF